MGLVSIILVYNEENLSNNIKNIEHVIDKSNKTYIINYGNDDLSSINYFQIIKTEKVFFELNKIIKKSADSDIFIWDLNIIPQTKNFLDIFNNIANKHNYNVIVSGITIFNKMQAERKTGFVFSCGNKIIGRNNYFSENCRIGYGDSLLSLSTKQEIEPDTVDYLFLFIPQQVVNLGIFFDESIEIFIIKSVMIDDFCLNSAVKNVKLISSAEIIGEVYYDEINYEYPEKLKEIFDNFWKNKWGWSLRNPDLNVIRKKYSNKKFVSKIHNDLITDIGTDPFIDVLIVSMNNIQQLLNTLKQLSKSNYKKIKVYIFNNGSNDNTKEVLDKLSKNYKYTLTVINSPVNVGIPVALNWLFSVSDSPVVVRMDDDVEISETIIGELYKQFYKYPYAGIISTKIIIDEDGLKHIHYAGIYGLSINTNINEYSFVAKTKIAGGPFLMYKRNAINKAGLWDIGFSPAQVEDVEHAFRIYQYGYDLIYYGREKVYHMDRGIKSVSISKLNRLNYLMTQFKTKYKITQDAEWNDLVEVLEK